ncbi:M23 family metallopeptidase [Candidatus Curtissbacteria bacterium]|nr:M23 family metallopeptidase [Candidatus Curtissbacteria bacterium]
MARRLLAKKSLLLVSRLNSLKKLYAFKATKRFLSLPVQKALMLTLNYLYIELKVRPRAKFSMKAIFALMLGFALTSFAAPYLRVKQAEIKINGQPILAAGLAEEAVKNEAETEISLAVVGRLSPFEFSSPVEKGYVSQGYFSYHRANDIATNLGAPIKPVGPGIVEFAGFTPDGKGNIVIVTHGDGLKTLYAHMGRINVGVGNMVTTNSVLGNVGMTGRTTGPHVHLEIYDNDQMVDPSSVLPTK